MLAEAAAVAFVCGVEARLGDRAMKLMAIAALGACLFAAAARAEEAEVPPACRADAAGAVDNQACADAAAPDSPARTLALINLGSRAFERGDYAAAVRYYDEAQPPDGEQIYSDAVFHAYRGAAYFHVGRDHEALADARIAVGLLKNDEDAPAEARRHFTGADVNMETVYLAILPILQRAHAPELADALIAYRALPARDWVSLANRAAIFEQMGDIEGAVAASQQALAMAPNHPAVLNNHCYILTRAGRAAEALPFCQRAVDVSPNVAAARHSYAAALAATGDCIGAARELGEARRLDPIAPQYRSSIACRRQ
jgi:Flp pilus assembly protein TadD